MKIIHVTPSYKPAWCYGGPTRSISLLCESLSKSKQEVQVFTTTANGPAELRTPAHPVTVEGVRVQYFKRITKDHTHFSPALLYHLYKKTSHTNQDIIIHIHSWWNLTAMLSCLIAIINHKPVILSPRGMLSDYTFSSGNKTLKLFIHKVIGKKLITYCHIHATSLQEKLEILESQAVRSICIIPNLTQQQEKKTSELETIVKPPTFSLLFLSRIDEKKGLELLFKSVVRLGFPWTLTIAGTGTHRYTRSLKDLADTLSISKSIIWAGEINNTNKYPMMASHHLLVLFSHNENFANVILESLSVGTAVAISNQVGLSDYVQCNQLGWVADLTVASITDVLNQAHRNDKQRQAIKDSGPSLITKHFSRADLTQQYINLYRTHL